MVSRMRVVRVLFESISTSHTLHETEVTFGPALQSFNCDGNLQRRSLAFGNRCTMRPGAECIESGREHNHAQPFPRIPHRHSHV